MNLLCLWHKEVHWNNEFVAWRWWYQSVHSKKAPPKLISGAFLNRRLAMGQSSRSSSAHETSLSRYSPYFLRRSLINSTITKKSLPTLVNRDYRIRRLAMTYFHMGRPHTIIGAATFHFWVRHGIRWYHSAVVPPDPLPNSEVKRSCADDSVGSPHVKVGHC